MRLRTNKLTERRMFMHKLKHEYQTNKKTNILVCVCAHNVQSYKYTYLHCFIVVCIYHAHKHSARNWLMINEKLCKQQKTALRGQCVLMCDSTATQRSHKGPPTKSQGLNSPQKRRESGYISLARVSKNIRS